ncbi:filamentous hemagglutinin N-terminal domain-containing protein, partial [Mesorhizobium japonicum]|uniref:two-partner secretion domain-containing protein n=1 Tax=Mesorhizobium japonicum TaxID=2066070 RepID=UPI003B598C2C
ASQINGSLTSNGTLFVLNPNGVLFGQGANVNVGALVASTSALNADNFMNGNYVFTPGGKGQISNAGRISTATGGAVLLAGGGHILNTGTIEAPEGSIQMVSADRFSVTLPTHNPFLNVKVETSAAGN